MCNQLLFPKELMMFGMNIPPAITQQLQLAVNAYEDSERAEQLLWQAHGLNPRQAETYIAIYKFYFYKNRLQEAEKVAREALAVCAESGGFDPDWRVLTPASADWSVLNGPQRIYLYTLKALGFMRLRRRDFAEGQAILHKLQELDPNDQVGGSVLLELAAGLSEVVNGLR